MILRREIVEGETHVHIQYGKMPLGVKAGGILRILVAPDLDIVAGPVGTAKVYLCAEKVNQPVDVDLAGNVQVV